MIKPAATTDDLSAYGEALLESVAKMHREQVLNIEHAIAAGFETGMRKILADEQLVEVFWRKGFDRITHHGSLEASRWVGKRFLTAIVLALFGVSVAWLVKLGVFK